MITTIIILALNAIFIGSCSAKDGSLRTLQSVGNIVRFELIDGVTQKRIRDLYHKAVIDITTIPGMTEPSFNVRAILSGGAAVVVFDYQSTLDANYDYSSPFTLCSSAMCPDLGFGTHTVRATPYSSTSFTTAGKRFSIEFEIRRSHTVPMPVSKPLSKPVPLPVSKPVPMPVSKPVPVPAPLSQHVSALQLMNANARPNTVVMNLKFGTTNLINLRKLGLSDYQFNIQALIGGSTQSVMFNNGVVETIRPLAYCGNNGDIFNVCNDLIVGTTLNVTVTGYPLAGAMGTPYPLQWAAVKIVRSVSKVPIAPPKVAPVPAPVIRPVTAPLTARTCTIPKFPDNTWWSTPSAPYPISVSESQGSMIGKDFVIFSGFKDGYSVATTETYALDMSISSARWRRMDDMPFPQGLTHLGIAVVGMKAYICGGYVGGSLGTQGGDCFIYDHSKPARSGQQWSSFAPLPKGGRSGGGMIYDSAMNALVYTAGSQRPVAGQNSAIDYTDTWMYSIKNPNAGWVAKTNIPFHGNHMNFVTALDGFGRERHYFFGGQHGDFEEDGNTATMYEYVATTDTWIQRASMPFPRGHSAASSRAIGCGFVIAGGRTNTGLTNDVTYYDIPTNTWRSIGTLPVEVHTNVCVVYNGMLRCETGWSFGIFTAERTIVL